MLLTNRDQIINEIISFQLIIESKYGYGFEISPSYGETNFLFDKIKELKNKLKCS
jgi:hypothetical protein